MLALVGVVNIPIIHYSVEWWSTLHQGPTVTKLDKPSIHLSMLVPLLTMALAFKLYYASVLLMRARTEVLERDAASAMGKTISSGAMSDPSAKLPAMGRNAAAVAALLEAGRALISARTGS